MQGSVETQSNHSRNWSFVEKHPLLSLTCKWWTSRDHFKQWEPVIKTCKSWMQKHKRQSRWCLVCATKSKSVWTKNNTTIFKSQPPNTVPKGSRLLQHTWCRKTHKDICAHACNTDRKKLHILSLSHTHKHTYTNGSQVLCIIQWNKSKHNNICTQIQTTQSSHGLWPSKHTDKEQTTLTDMQKVVLVMVLPWLWRLLKHLVP